MLFIDMWIVIQSRRNEKLAKEARKAIGGDDADGDSVNSSISLESDSCGIRNDRAKANAG